jgi:hypothetical protein
MFFSQDLPLCLAMATVDSPAALVPGPSMWAQWPPTIELVQGTMSQSVFRYEEVQRCTLASNCFRTAIRRASAQGVCQVNGHADL